jgi:hypothetical protein
MLPADWYLRLAREAQLRLNNRRAGERVNR